VGRRGIVDPNRRHDENLIEKFMKKTLFFIAGMLCLGIAYIGVVTPGIPWSTPSFLAAYCFARSSDKWHNWMLNHKLFGPFLKNWGNNSVYPTKIKWLMFIAMDTSLIILWFTTYNVKLVVGVALFMAFWMIWAIRYPGSVEEFERRKAAGERIGWFK
jgi:uncharacterized membrane protein YbaN (DUF454 family)